MPKKKRTKKRTTKRRAVRTSARRRNARRARKPGAKFVVVRGRRKKPVAIASSYAKAARLAKWLGKHFPGNAVKVEKK